MLKNLKNKKKKKGFTLIELIIVIAIIAILAALAIPKFGDIRRNANAKADIANAKTIANATAALLAEESISTSNSPINLSESNGDAAKIKDYLQTEPTVKLGQDGDNFIVDIGDGEVKVHIASETNSITEENQVYPEPNVANEWYPNTGENK